MTQTSEHSGGIEVEVEETVRTRVNPDGTTTKVTELRKPDGSVRVVEETTQEDGRKTITVKEFMAHNNTAPGTYPPPPGNVQTAPMAHNPSMPPNYPPMNSGFHAVNQPPPHYPPVMHKPVPAHRPPKRMDSDEEMCCGDFPKFGNPSECRPAKHPVAKEGMIKWAWCPTFSWLRVIFITSWMITFLGLMMLIAGAALQGTGLIITGTIFLIGGIVMTWIFGIWKWNADKQGAYKIARGKRVEAMALWKDIDARFYYQAKDTFYETRYGGKVLRVLRDGTIEIEGSHQDSGGDDHLDSLLKSGSNAAEMASNLQGAVDVGGM